MKCPSCGSKLNVNKGEEYIEYGCTKSSSSCAFYVANVNKHTNDLTYFKLYDYKKEIMVEFKKYGDANNLYIYSEQFISPDYIVNINGKIILISDEDSVKNVFDDFINFALKYIDDMKVLG